MSAPFAPEPDAERDNGLRADAYRRLRSIDVRECEILLEAMADAQIACYTAVPDNPQQATRDVFVDASARHRADEVADEAHRRYAGRCVSLDSAEVDSRFAELIGTFNGPSDVPDLPEPEPQAPPEPSSESAEPPAGWRTADGDWLAEAPLDDDDHFEPPPPEPLPRPTRKVAIGILLMIAGCVSLFAPTTMPVSATSALVIGVLLLGAGTGWLVLQLRDRPDDPFDDGSRV